MLGLDQRGGGDGAQACDQEAAAAGDETEALSAETAKPAKHGSGRMEILGEITAPIDVEWDAESNPDRVMNS